MKLHHLLLAAAALPAVLVAANMGPPKPQQTLGPKALTACGCTDFVRQVQKCQGTSSAEAKSCLCVDTWYSTGMACRDCLSDAEPVSAGTSVGSIPSLSTQYFDIFSQAVINAFVACTETGGSITASSNNGICAHANTVTACARFDTDVSPGRTNAVVSGQMGTESKGAAVQLDLGNEAGSAGSSETTSPSSTVQSSSAQTTPTAGESSTTVPTTTTVAGNSTGNNATAPSSAMPTTVPGNGAARLGGPFVLIGAAAAVFLAAF